MFKKLISVALIGVMVFSIGACGSTTNNIADDSVSSSGSSKKSTKKNYTDDDFVNYCFWYTDGDTLHLTSKQIDGVTKSTLEQWLPSNGIKKIVIDDLICINDLSFSGYRDLIQIDNIENLIIKSNRGGIFSSTYSLQIVDFKNFDTSNITNMREMFDGSNLQKIDVSNWDTSNVINMSQMFLGCHNLQKIDVSNWDTSKVTDMNLMFANTSIKEFNGKKWDTSNVTDMSSMFMYTYLEEFNANDWNVEKVKSFSCMFGDCRNLSKININKWHFGEEGHSHGMFACTNLKTYPSWYHVGENENDRNYQVSTKAGYIEKWGK